MSIFDDPLSVKLRYVRANYSPKIEKVFKLLKGHIIVLNTGNMLVQFSNFKKSTYAFEKLQKLYYVTFLLKSFVTNEQFNFPNNSTPNTNQNTQPLTYQFKIWTPVQQTKFKQTFE